MLEALKVDKGDEGDEVREPCSVQCIGDKVCERWLNRWRIAGRWHIWTLECCSNEPTRHSRRLLVTVVWVFPRRLLLRRLLRRRGSSSSVLDVSGSCGMPSTCGSGRLDGDCHVAVAV